MVGLGRDDLARGLRAVGEGQLDGRRAVDDVQAREDVAVLGDDDAAAEAAVGFGLALLRGERGLDEDQRGLDGRVELLREGRWRRLRGEGARDRVVDVLLGDRRRRGLEGDVQDHRREDHGHPGHERAERAGRAGPRRPPGPPRARAEAGRCIGRPSSRWWRYLGHRSRPRDRLVPIDPSGRERPPGQLPASARFPSGSGSRSLASRKSTPGRRMGRSAALGFSRVPVSHADPLHRAAGSPGGQGHRYAAKWHALEGTLPVMRGQGVRAAVVTNPVSTDHRRSGWSSQTKWPAPSITSSRPIPGARPSTIS